MYELNTIKLLFRCNGQGKEDIKGSYFLLSLNVHNRTVGEHDVQMIVKDSVLDDFAMDVAAEVDGARG